MRNCARGEYECCILVFFYTSFVSHRDVLYIEVFLRKLRVCPYFLNIKRPYLMYFYDLLTRMVSVRSFVPIGLMKVCSMRVMYSKMHGVESVDVKFRLKQ
jgi:hypothetical protein